MRRLMTGYWLLLLLTIMEPTEVTTRPCSDLQPIHLLSHLTPDRDRLPAGVEIIYDQSASLHAYHFTERAGVLSFPAAPLFPFCSFFPEEFSVLATFRAGSRTSARDETLVAVISTGTTKVRFGIRLYKGKLHVDYSDRRTRRRKVTEFKQMKLVDKAWHTIIVTISAARVSLQTDCGKRRTKRLVRAFPAMLDITQDNIHIGNVNKQSKGRFTGYLKQLLLLPGADISQQTCPAATPQLPGISVQPPPPLNIIPDVLPPLDYNGICTWQNTGKTWFDVYKKTLNVCYSGVWQPVLLPPDERGMKRLDYLVWHQDIVTAAPTIDLEVFRIPEEGLFMVTASFDSREMSKQQSAIFKWERGRFKMYQSMYTLGAQAWEHFQIGKKFFLAVANQGAQRDKPSKSVIYVWNRKRRRFRMHQELVTYTARDIEYFSIRGSHYLAVANHVYGQNHSISSMVFVYNTESERFDLMQEIPTIGAYDFTHFAVDGFHFLVVANSFSGPPVRTTKLNSVIYFWTDGEFLPFQSLETTGATDWEFFTVDNDFYLVVANAYNYGPHKDEDVDPFKTNSTIYRLNKTLKMFELYQNIITYSAVDWEFFTVGGDSYLLVSNAQNGAAANSNSANLPLAQTRSVLYRWQGVEKFVPVHYLDTLPSADWEVFSTEGEIYLVYANAKNNISQMYKVKYV